jgi:hypothetical protein
VRLSNVSLPESLKPDFLYESLQNTVEIGNWTLAIEPVFLVFVGLIRSLKAFLFTFAKTPLLSLGNLGYRCLSALAASHTDYHKGFTDCRFCEDYGRDHCRRPRLTSCESCNFQASQEHSGAINFQQGFRPLPGKIISDVRGT